MRDLGLGLKTLNRANSKEVVPPQRTPPIRSLNTNTACNSFSRASPDIQKRGYLVAMEATVITVDEYDVFVSHCGKDSKRNFASWLTTELERVQLRCFLMSTA
jgi:hypothetical protein